MQWVQTVAFLCLCCSWFLTWLVVKLDSMEISLATDFIPASIALELEVVEDDAAHWGIVNDTFVRFLMLYTLSVAASVFVARDETKTFTAK